VTAPYVLLHGIPLTPEIWRPVVAELAATEAPTTPQLVADIQTPIGEIVPELARQVGERLAQISAPVHLVGHSFGGQVAIEVALLFPARVARLTLLCSRDTPFPPFAAAAAALRAGQPADPAATLNRWFRPAELERADPVVGYAERCVRDADPEVWAAALDAIATFDRADRTSSLIQPVHLVAAEFDQVSTVAAMTALAGRLPRARLTVLTGSAHLSPFLDPAALARLLTD
jgi:pimeloyl-ACP methyl ester carboxylesterase